VTYPFSAPNGNFTVATPTPFAFTTTTPTITVAATPPMSTLAVTPLVGPSGHHHR
jgi:hypothetical protein